MWRNPFVRDGYTGRTPLALCPVCFQKLDAYTNLTGHDKAEPGDYTICIGCRSVLRFGPGLGLEKSSLLEVPVHLRAVFAKVIRVMEESPLPRQEKK
jgi:hypothetical protein